MNVVPQPAQFALESWIGAVPRAEQLDGGGIGRHPAAQRRLGGRTAAAEVPIVGPIAADQRNFFQRNLPQPGEHVVRRGQPEPRLAAFLVPATHDVRQVLIGRRVVVHQRRVRGRQVHEIIWVVQLLHMPQVLVQSGLDGIQISRVRIAPLVEHAVVLAVQHEQFAPAGTLPTIDGRPRFGRAAQVQVDPHHEQFDTAVQQQVHGGPGNAGHVMLMDDSDVGAQFLPQRADVVQLPCQPFGRTQRRGVVLEPRDAEPAGLDVLLEPLDLLGGRRLQPPHDGRRYLRGPSRFGQVVRPGFGPVEHVQGRGQVVLLQFPVHRLRVRIANVHVAVVKDEDFVTEGHIVGCGRGRSGRLGGEADGTGQRGEQQENSSVHLASLHRVSSFVGCAPCANPGSDVQNSIFAGRIGSTWQDEGPRKLNSVRRSPWVAAAAGGSEPKGQNLQPPRRADSWPCPRFPSWIACPAA